MARLKVVPFADEHLDDANGGRERLLHAPQVGTPLAGPKTRSRGSAWFVLWSSRELARIALERNRIDLPAESIMRVR